MSKEIERAIAFAEEYRKRLVSYIEFGEAQRGETKLNEWETILFSLQAQLDQEKEPDEWISVEDRLPDVEEKMEPVYDLDTFAEIDVRYHMVSNLVLVVVKGENGDRFVSDDVLVDGKWANYPFPEWDITNWMPLPGLPKEENHELLGNKPKCV